MSNTLLTITVQGQEVEEFVYLGSLIHSTTQSTQDINRRSAITHTAMQSLDNQIWRSQLVTTTKLRLYNVHCASCQFSCMDQSAGWSPRWTCIGLKRWTSGAFKCCWASNGTTLSEMMMFRGKQSN